MVRRAVVRQWTRFSGSPGTYMRTDEAFVVGSMARMFARPEPREIPRGSTSAGSRAMAG